MISLAATAIAGVLAPVAAAVLAVGLLLTALVLPWAMVTVARHPTQRRDAARDARRVITSELVDSALELSTSPQLEDRLGALKAAQRSIRQAERSLAWRRGIIGSTSLLVSVATVAMLSVVASDAVAAGALAASAVAVLPLLAMGALEITSAMSPAMAKLPADTAAARRLGELTAAEAAWPEPPGPGDDVALATSVELDEVTIGHGASLIAGLSLDIGPGSRIAIVGPSGSGKSTLLDAIARFVAPRTGIVRLGGSDIADLLGSQVRQRVVSLEQEPHLFASDLEANVRLARPGSTGAEIDRVLDAVGLTRRMDRAAAEATATGEGGIALSGGERHRVGIARILLSEAPVVLLDEPTEGLDEEAAAAVMTVLCKAAGDRAIVIATHRPADARAMDRVLAIDDGRLVELAS